jgi:hypothetical protein
MLPATEQITAVKSFIKQVRDLFKILDGLECHLFNYILTDTTRDQYYRTFYGRNIGEMNRFRSKLELLACTNTLT